MRRNIKLAFVTIVLAGASLNSVLPALADNVSVAVNGGGIAFGYSDGYWDQNHRWHAWKNEQEAAEYREKNREHYYDQRHDHDNDKGWHENDHWWEKH